MKPLSKTRVYEWHKRFSAGRERVENEPHVRPRTFTEENICVVRKILEGDRRLTLEEIAGSVGISHGNIYSIIHNKLDIRKVSARWLPRLLTPIKKRLWFVIKMKEKGYLIS
ncbi:hypothetical protein NQ318_023085 [Aromia moschata]|uniref:Transposase n=1 Tax=Aromia moschata TaxID=1265417 RepID=A0AAV8XLL6_9CUCU|nr:hypothetical protein NQ318_023085 [Aromia moschata]